MPDKKSTIDTKEFEIPETVYVRDIEDEVFEGIVLKILSTIKGIALISGSFFDRSVKGIHIKQDSKNHSVSIKIEINIHYGVSIPEKAEEIQSSVAHAIAETTGLHVSSIHVVFKNIESADAPTK